MDKDLGTTTDWQIIEPIQSIDFDFCLECGCKITNENDSGWEKFRENGRTTQKVCKKCDGKNTSQKQL